MKLVGLATSTALTTAYLTAVVLLVEPGKGLEYMAAPQAVSCIIHTTVVTIFWIFHIEVN